MIIDTLDNAALYQGLERKIRMAFDYLAHTDLSAITPGRYALDGDQVYALVEHYTTRPREQGVWEAHRRYLDVQYVVEGLETIGYAHIASLSITQPYSLEKDRTLFAGTGDFLTVRAGTFLVFFPEDGHIPGLVCGEPQTVCKVVIKVAVG